MKKQIHNKLVRDNIPEILEDKGIEVEEQIMLDPREYEKALRDKLVEESQEVLESDSEHLLEEMGDVMSVLDAMCAFYGFSAENLLTQQKRKDIERGTFKGRIKLVS